jgi:hypothetical protein
MPTLLSAPFLQLMSALSSSMLTMDAGWEPPIRPDGKFKGCFDFLSAGSHIDPTGLALLPITSFRVA